MFLTECNMNLFNVLLIGIGLAMDAAAVSLCKGLAVGKAKMRHCVLAGAYFGVFQGLMPAIGYALGRTFAEFINAFDHWVAFILLALIGANMLKESFEEECGECQSSSFAPAVMLPMAVATSIDALAVGVTFSFDMNWMALLMAVAIIAAVTFAISAVAVRLGSLLGARFGHWAERAGGTVLILMGVKILLEGLGVL